jgi:hypothetical protein
MDQTAESTTDTRTCTCYPGEGPDPCPRRFALRDCWRAVVREETQSYIVALKNRDRQPHEQALLDYLMRVRQCLDV